MKVSIESVPIELIKPEPSDRETLAYTNGVLERVEAEYTRYAWNTLEAQGFSKKGDYCFIYSYPPVRTLEPLPDDLLHRPGRYGSLNEPTSMYVHIPYCTAICSYCYFAKTVDNKLAPIQRSDYPEYLKKELNLHLKRFGGKPVITTIHLGGGTPSTLTVNEMAEVLEVIRQSCIVQENAEITVECAPETIIAEPEKVAGYRALGINRFNLGVESLDPMVLRKMGRRHGNLEALRALDIIIDAGCDNINVDVIYDLPGQTLESWVRTLRILEQRKVQSISVYRLRKHPKKAITRQGAGFFPEYDVGLKMQLAHGIVMSDAGFVNSSSHKYARGIDKLQRQVEDKRGVERTQLLSIGCGAYGFVNDTFYWNTKSLTQYKELLDQEKLPLWVGQSLDKEELMRKSLAIGMHTHRGVAVAELERKYGVDPLEFFASELKFGIDAGVLEIENGYIRPTKTGRFFSDEISVKFYSKAVKEKLAKLNMKYGMFFEDDKYA